MLREVEAMREIDNAEEQGMTLPEFRQFMAEEDCKAKAIEEHMASPAYQADIEQSRQERRALDTQHRAIDVQVAAIAIAHFGKETPLTIEYYGEGDQQVAVVRQRIGGNPKTCRVHTATMTIQESPTE
jgi:hypothetical protein